MEDRLLELLESVLGISKKTSGDNYAFYSPFVDHYKPKLEINIRITSNGQNPWHCWISDEKGRTIKTLFKKLRVSKQIWDEYNSIFSRINRYSYDQANDQANDQVELPKEFKPLYKPTNSYKYKHAMNYVLGRGIRPTDIVKYNIGYCEEGLYKNMIILPTYDKDGNINYYTARSFEKDAFVKYRNPQVSRDIIPNEHFINWNLPIILCEGLFDAMAIKRNAIPLLGKNIQSNLMKKIVTSVVDKIYIALDRDAIKQALKFCEKLMAEGKEVYLVDLQDKDPSEMGFKNFTKLIQKTVPLTYYNLMEQKLSI